MNIRRLKRKLERADGALIDSIFDTVLNRKMQLYPDWEILYLALPKDDAQMRKETIKFALQHMLEE